MRSRAHALSMLFAFVALCFFITNNIVAAADTAQRALKIVTIPLPPWGYKKPDGTATGICYDWADAIAERMGRKAENRILPMPRVFKDIEYGRADFTIMLRTKASEKVSIPVANVAIPFKTIIWPRFNIPVYSYHDLKNVRLSMARGLKVGGEFAKQKNLKISPSIDYAHSMQMFSAGRVDAIVGTQQSLLYNAYKAGINPTTAFSRPFEVARLEGWVQASHSFAEREGLKQLQEAAQSLIDDGTFLRIYKKHNSLMGNSLIH